MLQAYTDTFILNANYAVHHAASVHGDSLCKCTLCCVFVQSPCDHTQESVKLTYD